MRVRPTLLLPLLLLAACPTDPEWTAPLAPDEEAKFKVLCDESRWVTVPDQEDSLIVDTIDGAAEQRTMASAKARWAELWARWTEEQKEVAVRRAAVEWAERNPEIVGAEWETKGANNVLACLRAMPAVVVRDTGDAQELLDLRKADWEPSGRLGVAGDVKTLQVMASTDEEEGEKASTATPEEFGEAFERHRESIGLTAPGHAKSRPVVVAVIDSAFDVQDPRLEPAIAGQACFTKGEYCDGKYPAAAAHDWESTVHGTAVAGIIAGGADANLPGLSETPLGIAPDARILALKVHAVDHNMETVFGAKAGFLLALDHAARWKGRDGERVSVVNVSVDYANLRPSKECEPRRVRNTIKMLDELNRRGIAVVLAAGNAGPWGTEPSCAGSDLAVGAAWQREDGTWERAHFSGCPEDGRATASDAVGVMAGGEGIPLLGPDGGWLLGDGTSFAAPQVSAMIARTLGTDSSGKSPAAIAPGIAHQLASVAVTDDQCGALPLKRARLQ